MVRPNGGSRSARTPGMQRRIIVQPSANCLHHEHVREARDDCLASWPELSRFGGHEAERAVHPLSVRDARSVELGCTPLDVRSAGTRIVVDAMREAGVKKLIVQTSYGVGDSRGRLPLKWKTIFALLLKPQIEDTELQESIVKASGLDWVLVQPVGLTDDDNADEKPFVSTEADAREMRISRRSVARWIAAALPRADFVGRSVALSGAARGNLIFAAREL